MQFSVVVATNNFFLLKKIVQRIDKSSTSHTVEVIIVNNNLNQNLKGISPADFPSIELKIVNESLLGASFSRNMGIKLAKYKTVVIVDQDVFISKDFFTKLSKKWKEYPDARIITYRILAHPLKGKFTSIQKETIRAHSWCFTQCDYEGKDKILELGESFLGASFSYQKKSKKNNPLFDERLGVLWNDIFIGGEDVELSARLILSGEKIVLTDDITVFHKVLSERLSRSSLMRRYIFTAWDKLLVEKILNEKFPGRYRSFADEIKEAFINIIRLKKMRKSVALFSSSFRLALIASYFINRPIFSRR